MRDTGAAESAAGPLAWPIEVIASVDKKEMKARPEVVATGFELGWELAADERHVFVEESVVPGKENGKIVALSHQMPTIRTTLATVGDVRRLEDAGRSLLVVTEDSQVLLLSKVDGSARLVAHGADAVATKDAVYVYRRKAPADQRFSDGAMVIERYPLAVGAGQLIGVLDGQWSPQRSDLIVAGEQICWLAFPSSEAAGVMASVILPQLACLSRDGGQPRLLGSWRMADTLSFAGGKLFGGALTSVYRANADSGSVEQLVLQASTEDFAATRTHVFGAAVWDSGPHEGCILVFDVDAAAVRQIPRPASCVRIAVGGPWLYWLEYTKEPLVAHTANRLLRLPLSLFGAADPTSSKRDQQSSVRLGRVP